VNGAFELGAVTLRANQRALETMANNIANMNTPAYKRADVIYAEVAGDAPGAINTAQSLDLAAQAMPGGVRVAERQMFSAQGELRSSSNALDIAIDGRGFIELMGAEGQTVLWRGGRLEVNRDGYLAAPGGALRAMIAVPEDAADLKIDRDGKISATTSDNQAIELGQLSLVRVDNNADLERTGSGLLVTHEDARVVETAPGEDGSGTIAQGMLEGSNVDFSAAMVELLMVQRAYAASAQIVQAADQLASISNNLKR
jgi:flagellar basal-body rod protein FlgG